MATKLTTLPAEIITTANTSQEYQFNHPMITEENLLLCIELPSANSGTVQVNSGASANNASCPDYPASTKTFVPIRNGVVNLFVYASATSDKIWITKV